MAWHWFWKADGAWSPDWSPFSPRGLLSTSCLPCWQNQTHSAAVVSAGDTLGQAPVSGRFRHPEAELGQQVLGSHRAGSRHRSLLKPRETWI